MQIHNVLCKKALSKDFCLFPLRNNLKAFCKITVISLLVNDAKLAICNVFVFGQILPDASLVVILDRFSRTTQPR